MALSDLLDRVTALFTHRVRRAWTTSGRVHIELPRVDRDELADFTERLRAIAREYARIEWIDVNSHTWRVVIAFEAGAYTLEELTELVERAEAESSIAGAPFGDHRHEHPADAEPALRSLVELAADLWGLMTGLGLLVSPIPGSSVAGSAAAILSLVKNASRLRSGLDERYGPHTTDLLLNLSIALTQGLAQRPVSSLVDIATRVTELREIHARRVGWRERESELYASPPPAFHHQPAIEPRPVPIPRGPIEEYSDRAWFVSLGGFALSFLATRSVQRALAALFGGIPKPARFGRETFAAELCRVLVKRGILILDPEVLRRLDRIDCVVLPGNLLSRERFVVAQVHATAGADGAEARSAVARLFDSERPLDMRREGEWTLGPIALHDAALDRDTSERAAALASRGAIVLGLAKSGRVRALIDVEVTPQTGVEELITAAHEAQMRVVIASDDESTLEGLNADDVIPGGEGLVRGLRRLQREGRVVAVIATGDSPGLPVADCGIGLCRTGEPPPWGAHLVCRSDLLDVRFILESCVTARRIAKQSVNIALGAATVGAFVSAGGLLPMTSRRVLTVVNAATLLSMANGARASYQLVRKALPPPRDPTPWHALDAAGVLARLGTSQRGLSRREASARAREEIGPAPALLQLAGAITDELFNPLSPLLAAGAGLSAMVGSVADAAMVSGVVGLNAVVGGAQRFRTERAVQRLARDTRRRALVVRDGQTRDVDASELVRGDLVLLHPGDVVPADCRIVEATSLEVDASSLTGESLPVRKRASPSFEASAPDRSSMVFEGTSIAAGRAKAVVVAVGSATEARRTAAAAKGDRAHGGVEQRLRSLMTLTGPVALGAGVGVVGAGLLRGRRLADVVGSGVSLAVAAVPEGLPMLASAAQLSAAKRLARRGALVRNARSVEALGRVDVVCLDKTGTLTRGQIELTDVSDGRVTEPVDRLGGARANVLAVGLRASTGAVGTSRRSSDPMDDALSRGASAAGVGRAFGAEGWRPITEISFEAGRGYQAVQGRTARGGLLCVKGAPEILLPACTRWRTSEGTVDLDGERGTSLSRRASVLARSGLRVVAVAERCDGPDEAPASLDPRRVRELTLLGFLAFRDPVRPTASDALRRLRRAGIETVMITGDHPSTAEAIGEELGLLMNKRLMTGAELSALDDEQLDAVLPGISVFARVTPAQKVRIVRSLQRAGRVVAMAGDGANDAPAIRLAEVGLAVGERCTSAARGAADVVLTDERIETLVEAVVEGRAMWASVRDALSILIGGNLGEIGFTLAAGLVDGRPPLNARQLLLVNLLTDVAPAMAIALRPPSREALEAIAEEGPDASLASPLNRDIAWRSVVTAAGAGGAWVLGRLTGSTARANTIGLAALVGTQLGQTIASGGLSRPVVLTSVGSMVALFGIISTPGVSQFFGCRPLGPLGWTTAVAAAGAATYASVRVPEAGARWIDGVRMRLADAAERVEAIADPSRRLGPS